MQPVPGALEQALAKQDAYVRRCMYKGFTCVRMCMQVLGPLGHAKLGGSYMPRVEAAFPEKAQLRVQARMSPF